MAKFRFSSLKEREKYYQNEFSWEKVKNWFKKNNLPLPQLYAIDMGSETGIIKDKVKHNKLIILRATHLKEKFLKYLPEDIYYDRNHYKDPEKALKELDFQFPQPNVPKQELDFDVDSDNFPCDCQKNYPSFCQKCLKKSIQEGVKLGEYLLTKFNKIGLIYSGRGIHVHVFDKRAFSLTIKEREELAEEVKKFGVDPWVSRGRIRLIRLPYSLNALVSRIVLPLTFEEAREFNPLTSEKVIPDFLK